MKEDRYYCLGLNKKQERVIRQNIDKNYFSKTVSVEHLYLVISKDNNLFNDCVVGFDGDKPFVQKIIKG